jgi:hypothetical protein
MYTTAEEIINDPEYTIFESQARREIKKHGATWEEFLDDVGTFDGTGRQVLLWLGY